MQRSLTLILWFGISAMKLNDFFPATHHALLVKPHSRVYCHNNDQSQFVGKGGNQCQVLMK